MHILHAYKVCHTEIYGGIPEVIRTLTNSRQRGVTSGVLAARMRGWGRHLASGTSPIKLTGSFGTLASTPITPSYPFALVREDEAPGRRDLFISNNFVIKKKTA